MQRTFPIRYAPRPHYHAADEQIRSTEQDDALRPARGVLVGVMTGAAFWALLILAYFVA